MRVCAVFHAIKPVGEVCFADFCLQIHPERNFCAVERRLFNHGTGTCGNLRHCCKQRVVLVGGIAEKIALNHGGGTFQCCLEQRIIVVQNSVELLLECLFGACGVNDYVVFCHTILCLKLRNFSQGVLGLNGYSFLYVSHSVSVSCYVYKGTKKQPTTTAFFLASM